MPKIKFKSDNKGAFYKQDTFDLVEADFVSPGSDKSKVFVKLLTPKDASSKVLTLTINKKTIDSAVVAG